MLGFWSNWLLSEPLYFLLILLGLVVISHLLFVWPKNLSKKEWKVVDYFWLVIAVLGLFSLISDVRVSTANNWLKVERSRVSSFFEFNQNQVNPVASLACMYGRNGEAAPTPILRNEFSEACSWRYEISEYLTSLQPEEVPKINDEKIPLIKFQDPMLVKQAQLILKNIEQYGKNRREYQNIEKLSIKSEEENMVSYYTPFLLCIALALRLSKVTGELRHEHNNKVNRAENNSALN